MQTVRTLIAAAMAWMALGGGGASEAGPARLLTALQGRSGGYSYISSWDGHRVSAQAMRQVW